MASQFWCWRCTAAGGLRAAAATKAGRRGAGSAGGKWRLQHNVGVRPGESTQLEYRNFSTASAPQQPSDAVTAPLPPPLQPHDVAAAATASSTPAPTRSAASPLPFESMPGPRPLPLVGTSWLYSRLGPYGCQPNFLAREELRARYGPIYLEKFGKVPIVSVHEASDIEKVFRTQGRYPNRGVCEATIYRRKQYPELYNTPGLVDSMGEEWYQLRQRVGPLLVQPRKAASYLPTMVDLAQQFVQLVRSVREKNDDGVPELVKNINGLFYRYGLENIIACTLGKRMGALEPDLVPEAETLIKTSRELLRSLVEMSRAKPLYKYVPTPSYRRYCRIEENIRRIVSNYTDPLIADTFKHNQSLSGRGCPVSRYQDSEEKTSEGKKELLLVGKEVDIEAEVERSLFNQFCNIPDLDVRDFTTVIIDSISAGIPTVAFFLTLFVHRLGQEPRVLEKLQEEADRVLPPLSASSNSFTPETLHDMPYLRAAVQEGFRLTTIIPGVTRLLEQEVVIQGYRIPPYTPIICQTRAASRDKHNFSRPLEFLPERWIRPSRETSKEQSILFEETRRNRFLVLPFGFGPRMCPGRRIAENEIYVLLAKLVQNFNIRSSGSIELADFLVMGPKNPVDLWMGDRI